QRPIYTARGVPLIFLNRVASSLLRCVTQASSELPSRSRNLRGGESAPLGARGVITTTIGGWAGINVGATLIVLLSQWIERTPGNDGQMGCGRGGPGRVGWRRRRSRGAA